MYKEYLKFIGFFAKKNDIWLINRLFIENNI